MYLLLTLPDAFFEYDAYNWTMCHAIVESQLRTMASCASFVEITGHSQLNWNIISTMRLFQAKHIPSLYITRDTDDDFKNWYCDKVDYTIRLPCRSSDILHFHFSTPPHLHISATKFHQNHIVHLWIHPMTDFTMVSAQGLASSRSAIFL